MADVSRQIGSFEVLDTIGRGGMGTVYLARQAGLAREIALKELRFGQHGELDLADRFLQEARISGSLAHPNIVVVYDYFEADGAAYIAMEYLAGGSLAPRMRRLDLAQSVGVLESLLAGLAHAGARGIVHRDLKPANLLVPADGGTKIADFGIAKAYNSTALGLTGSGQALGTPAYMAPEQALAHEVDPRTDLYATGVIAYQLLAKRPPFDSSLPWPTLMYKHVHVDPPPLASVDPAIPPPLAAWVHRMLAKDPDARPRDASAAWAELEEIAVDLLGWRWRRDSRMGEAIDQAEPVEAVESGAPTWSSLRPDDAPTSTAREVVRVAHDAAVNHVAFGPEGRWIATASDDGTCRVCELATGDERFRVGHADNVTHLAVSPDGAHLATASRDGAVRVTATSSGDELLAIDGFPRGGFLGFSPSGRYLAVGGQVFELPVGNEVARVDGDAVVFDAHFTRGEQRIVSISAPGRVRVWDLAGRSAVTAFADDDFIHAAVSADGAHMTVIGLTKQARVWDLRDGRIVASLSHEGTVSWVVPGSASGAVATASEDGTVKVWEIPSARERARISHGAAVDFVAFVGGDDRLVSFTREPAVHVTRLPGGEVIARLAGETFDLSPDGRYVAMADADGGVRVCSSAGATLAAFEHRGLIDLYAGPNALVATRGRDLSVRVWDPYAPA